MKKLILFLLFAVPVLAQDQPRQLTMQEAVYEIGVLHIQLRWANEQIESMKATIKALQDENAKLKANP